jgi:gamma-glutamylputrescine oxidase
MSENPLPMKAMPYWLEVPVLKGSQDNPPRHSAIIIIGSGLTGVSAGHFLQKQGFTDITIIDNEPEKAASFRNCGHILHGTVESMKAFSEIHGAEKAKEIWNFSIQICDLVKETIENLGIQADYKQDGYLVTSIDETEDRECRESTEILNSMGFHSEYIDPQEVRKFGFKNCYGARYEKGSAQAHPTKFRNGVMKAFLDNGGVYHTDVKVNSIRESSRGVEIETQRGTLTSEAVVIAANAYSPLFSEFFNTRRLIEPFRGQIITSRPLRHQFKITYPHSFDHGYEYSLVTSDNRLMIGGWRNHSPTKEIGTYSLGVNGLITQGLKDFVSRHYEIDEEIQWEYGWSGIMGASSTSLPFIGPTSSERIFSCAGYTGHGFSWAHGSAELLAKVMAGVNVPDASKYFNPKYKN